LGRIRFIDRARNADSRPFSASDIEINGSSYFGPPLLVERLMQLLRLTPWVEEAVESKRVTFRVADALTVMLCAHLFKSGSRAESAVWG